MYRDDLSEVGSYDDPLPFKLASQVLKSYILMYVRGCYIRGGGGGGMVGTADWAPQICG